MSLALTPLFYGSKGFCAVRSSRLLQGLSWLLHVTASSPAYCVLRADLCPVSVPEPTTNSDTVSGGVTSCEQSQPRLLLAGQYGWHMSPCGTAPIVGKVAGEEVRFGESLLRFTACC